MPRDTSIEFRRDSAVGSHLIDAWSRVQPRTAVSSGYAELYAGRRGISEILAVVHLIRELNAIILRRGCGGLKHMTDKSLWLQEAVREYSI